MPFFSDLVTAAKSMNISGNPWFSVPAWLAPPFGVPSFTSQMNYTICQDNVKPETCGIDYLVNQNGHGCDPVNFKVARLMYCEARPGVGGQAADAYGSNSVAALTAGVSPSVEAIADEADLSVGNAHYGDNTGEPQQPYATPRYTALAVSPWRASAMHIYNVTGACNKGIVTFSGNDQVLNQYVYEDYLSAAGFALIFGNYRADVIDMSQATYSGYGLKVKHDTYIGSRNHTNTANVPIAKVNASDRVEMPTPVEFSSDRGVFFSNQTSAAGSQIATLTNAPAAGDPTHWLKVVINGQNFTIPAWAG